MSRSAKRKWSEVSHRGPVLGMSWCRGGVGWTVDVAIVTGTRPQRSSSGIVGVVMNADEQTRNVNCHSGKWCRRERWLI